MWVYGASKAAAFLMRRIAGKVTDGTYSTPVSGSTAAPDQLAPPATPGSAIVPCSVGGVKRGPSVYFWRIRRAFRCNSGVKSITSFGVIPCRSNGKGLVGKGCVGAVLSRAQPTAAPSAPQWARPACP